MPRPTNNGEFKYVAECEGRKYYFSAKNIKAARERAKELYGDKAHTVTWQ